ncbi:MAG: 16S rRNA (cytosine(1402)-N(4))-methyltransferase RsmH [Bacillota bacterium]
MDENKEVVHKRRVRYSGTHPKTFSEKYKEQNPELYKDEVEKIIAKGKTPAGMHISIMVDEILNFLDIKKGQVGLDATLGYGGHTMKMLEKLDGEGHIYGLDIDPIEILKTTDRIRHNGFSEEVFTPVHINFAEVASVSEKYGKFDFMLADLGVSSMQIDNPERGFSFKREGVLDLRLNPQKGMPVWEFLNGVSYIDLKEILVENSDEPLAHEISVAILRKIKHGESIDTTTKLKEIIEEVVENDASIPKFKKKEMAKKSCQRTFQALRIEVNHEFEVLNSFLDSLPNVLKSGGKIAVLTFHSGEDRLVKKAFKQLYRDGVFAEIATDVVRPSSEECRRNSRATSTKMRWAVMA